jgi:hypothetical protein
MSDRPNFLVVVTHSLDGSFELFSAHHTDGEAQTMHDRLADLLAGSPDSVHIVEVPEVDGVVKASGEPSAERSASRRRTATPPVSAAAPAPPPPVHKPVSRAKFAEEARRLAEAEASGIVTDTPMPDYSGAFS